MSHPTFGPSRAADTPESLATAAERFADALAEILATKLAIKMAGRGTLPSLSGQRLMGTEAAAQYLGRSIKAVRHMASKGKLPTVRMPEDGRVFFDVKDLNRIIEEGKS